MQYGNTDIHLSRKERETLIRRYMGKTVDIVIDRPIGFVHHTKGVTLHYTVNYGFLPGVMGGDLCMPAGGVLEGLQEDLSENCTVK